MSLWIINEPWKRWPNDGLRMYLRAYVSLWYSYNRRAKPVIETITSLRGDLLTCLMTNVHAIAPFHFSRVRDEYDIQRITVSVLIAIVIDNTICHLVFCDRQASQATPPPRPLMTDDKSPCTIYKDQLPPVKKPGLTPADNAHLWSVLRSFTLISDDVFSMTDFARQL